MLRSYLYLVHADDTVSLLDVVDARLYDERHVLDVGDRPQDILQLLHAVRTLVQVIRLALCMRRDRFGRQVTGRWARTMGRVVTSSQTHSRHTIRNTSATTIFIANTFLLILDHIWKSSRRFGFSTRSLGHVTKASSWAAETLLTC